MPIKYSITKKHSLSMKGEDHVCSYCGGEIEPIDTVDNSGNPTHWLGCKSCMIFNTGVHKDIYEISRKMVVNHGFKPYTFEDKPLESAPKSEKDYWTFSQISGTHDFIKRVIEYRDAQ